MIDVKKIVIAGCLCVGLGTPSLFAINENEVVYSSRSMSENIERENAEKFMYNKGLDDGLDEGKKIGYEMGVREAQKELSKYKNKIKALEVGKYLAKNRRITPPRVYQTRDANGNIMVKVKGCNIEGQLSSSEIIMLPSYRERSSNRQEYTGTSTKNADTPSDSVFLAGVDRKEQAIPRDPLSSKKATYRVFVDNTFNRKLFRGSGLAFAILPEKELKVLFKNNRDADDFLQRHGLSSGSDYSR